VTVDGCQNVYQAGSIIRLNNTVALGLAASCCCCMLLVVLLVLVLQSPVASAAAFLLQSKSFSFT